MDNDARNITERLLENLTTKQQEAVRIIDRDLEIVACAGAGKTRTITRRILNLIANGVKPEHIVAITFTKKAAAEMKGRIYKQGKDLLGNTIGFAGMFIGTIDSFCLKMLQDYNDEYTKYSVLDEVQTKIFIERYEQDSGFRGSAINNARNLNCMFNRYSRDWEKVDKYDKKLGIYVGLMSILNNCWFAKAYRERWNFDLKGMLESYNKCLRKHKFFDYSGLLREMIEHLDPESDTNNGTMSDFGRMVFEKVKYLTIDEYQDTNPAQEHLVKLFKRYGNANLCVVGDADQTIYQFRGSDESNILGFKELFNSEIKYLNEDFRSTSAVVDIAATSIANGHIDDEGYVRMKQGTVKGSYLEYEDGDTVWKSFDDFDDEADFICERVRALHDIGIPYKEMAILFRKRREMHYGREEEDFQRKMAEKLQRDDISYTIEGLNLLYLKKEYAAAKGIFVYLYEKMARPYIGEDGKGYRLGDGKKEYKYGFVSKADCAEKEKAAQEELKRLWLVPELDVEEAGLMESVRELASIDWSQKKYGNECNMQQIYQNFIGRLSVMGRTDDEAERIIYNLGKFSKIIADFELLYFRESPVFKISQFFKHISKVADGLYPEGYEENVYNRGDAVRIMTIHQSKGLEFTAVFVPTLAQNVFPGETFVAGDGKIYGPVDAIPAADWIPNYGGYAGGLKDERKMFYVAVTRAKKFLFLTYGRKYGNVDEIESVLLQEAKGSAYLKEYAGNIYHTDHLPEIEEEDIPITLNFSILSNYFDCPYRFKLSNLYGFVQPYTTEQGYGRMLHEIMMHIHRAWINGERLNRREVEKIAEDALYLPFASEPQLEKSLRGAKACAKAYYDQNEKDADKIVAAEMDINIEMGEGVSVNGRIDLVRRVDEKDGREKTAIVDLKSAGKDAEQCLNAEQLSIYAIGYEEMKGESADYLMIYNLDKPDGSENKSRSVIKEELDETKRHILEAARCIRKSELHKVESDKCEKCYVRGLCKSSK